MTRIWEHDLWQILPSALHARLAAIDEDEPDTSPPQQPALRDNVAVIPMKGILLNNADADLERAGFLNPVRIAQEIRVAAFSGTPIVLDVDSPGGTATGTPELASAVSQASELVPVVSFTNNFRASAAEFVSAPATQVTATPSAIVGSIGTVLTLVDLSKMLERGGITVRQFTGGKFKGAGSPFVTLTKEQQANIQERVDMITDQFRAHMMEFREELAVEDMEGQIFTGLQGAEIGLVDEVLETIADAVELAKQLT